MNKHHFGKWVGLVSTCAILIVGITPSTFNIPLMLRPWIFLASIIWIVVVSSGVFSS